MLSFARHGHWPPVRGLRGCRLFWKPTPKRLILSNYKSDSNQILCAASGQRGLLMLCFTSGFDTSKVAGGQCRPPNPAFSFKIFLSECTGPTAVKILRWLLEHVEMLSWARHGDWPPIKVAQRGVAPFWLWTQKRLLLPNYLSDSNQLRYAGSGRWGLVSLSFLSGSALSKSTGGDNWSPNPTFFEKHLSIYLAEYTDLNTSGGSMAKY